MKNEAIKSILLESLKAAEKTIESDVENNEETKKTVKYLLHFFEFLGIDAIEKLALEGKSYIQDQLQHGIEVSTKALASTVSSLMTMIITFLAVSVGLIFGAVAISLWLGSYFGNSALGFLISGVLWIVIAFTFTKLFFKRYFKMTTIHKPLFIITNRPYGAKIIHRN